MVNLSRLGCFAAVVVLLLGGTTWAQEPRPPAGPVEPIAAILDAFRLHQVVALGEPHGNEQAHAFRLALIRDPRFPSVVNDIVVESGNARYQAVMDRFLVGEPVPDTELRQAWQDTTQHQTWDSPIYEEFFRAVRQVNSGLPAPRRIRVWLGDPPIDWRDVRTRDDWWSWMLQRDTFPAQLIQREVLTKNRRALVIYGDNHLQRRIREINYELSDIPRFNVLISLLERDRVNVFTISTPTNVDLARLQPDVPTWPKPSLAFTKGTALGAVEFSDFFGNESGRATVRDGALTPLPREQWKRLALEEQFDAVLYLGAPSEMTTRGLDPALCGNVAYRRVRQQRFEITAAKVQAESLNRTCSAANR